MPSSAPERREEPQRRLTLAMIGERLGLSTATVSLALRDNPAVAEDTRLRVRQLAEDLGYIYDRSAASLRTSRSHIVGVVVHDILNPYFAELVRALEVHLAHIKLTVILGNHGDDFQRQRHFLEVMLQYRADGLILCPSVGTTPGDIKRLTRAALPSVLIARDVPELDDVPVIRGDDRRGIRLVTDHLIGLGHRRIAFVGGRSNSSAGRERRAGYEEALEAAGISPDSNLIFPDLLSRTEGRDSVPHVLQQHPTAIVAFNDLLAFGLIAGLRRAGLEPGRDIALTGYDDIAEAGEWSPALTSVWNGQQEVGRLAADVLGNLIAGRKPAVQRMLVTPELRVRETSCPPPDH
jgi:DNA-binding LacI/PurR family transcriptional regulator